MMLCGIILLNINDMKTCTALFLFMSLFCACNNNTTDKIKLTEIDAKNPVQEITIKAQGNTMDEMKYDITEITTYEKTTLRITLVNESTDGSMLHNFVLIKTGTAQTIAEQGLQAGTKDDYVPINDNVLIHTKMTKPGEISSITFTSPPKGTYDFICTYPGHWSMMRGRMIVK